MEAFVNYRMTFLANVYVREVGAETIVTVSIMLLKSRMHIYTHMHTHTHLFSHAHTDLEYQ